ncbi:Gfo/Idh/MocA family oxidoreductase [Clostridium sp.]|uniref:Gfo/Idh/MocA family protein n=1 Tax=Clostridium sp. TaxID=1506 RepID=UPI002A91298D|nr:Gfo/Idh/MocA family oxidoreductase [Clostridium sp.]MDY6011938.1 Gfo/Idh/MocA family oxidoreductase [Clostridium sp.]
MNKIRFGIIGTGKIVERFLDVALTHENFELVAMYSRSIEKAEEFGKKYGATEFFDDLNEFAKSKDIDAVYIASPNSLHSYQAILCLENKKHVLCEKPMASNELEVKAMIDAAKKNNVLLMEAMRLTVLPNFLKVKENLHKIGKVRRYFASYCQYSSRYDKYKEGIVLNAFKRELSNGSLMDIGVYCIHPMINLFGMPNKIVSESMLLESGVDGQGSALFSYEGASGVVMYSKISDSKLPLEIQGEEGTIIIDSILFKNAKIVYRDGREEIISVDQKENDMYYEIDEFIDVINRNETESKKNSYENSLMAIQAMDEIRMQIGLEYPADLK